jgi:hypothetical protein
MSFNPIFGVIMDRVSRASIINAGRSRDLPKNIPNAGRTALNKGSFRSFIALISFSFLSFSEKFSDFF